MEIVAMGPRSAANVQSVIAAPSSAVSASAAGVENVVASGVKGAQSLTLAPAAATSTENAISKAASNLTSSVDTFTMSTKKGAKALRGWGGYALDSLKLQTKAGYVGYGALILAAGTGIYMWATSGKNKSTVN